MRRRRWNSGCATRPIRWMMLSSVFSGGVAILRVLRDAAVSAAALRIDRRLRGSGSAAAVVAGAMIVGGLLVPYAGRIFKRRTSLLIAGMAVGSVALVLIGLAGNFWLVLLPVRGVVDRICSSHAGAAGLYQRHRAFETACDRAFGGQYVEFRGRRDIAAGTGQDRRSLGLSCVIFGKCRCSRCSRSRCSCWHGAKRPSPTRSAIAKGRRSEMLSGESITFQRFIFSVVLPSNSSSSCFGLFLWFYG